MKMLVVLCPEERKDDIRSLIAAHGVHAYSELPGVLGEGATGRHQDNRVFPGSSRMIFTVADEAKTAELETALRQCAATLRPGEGLRAFVLPVEEML